MNKIYLQFRGFLEKEMISDPNQKKQLTSFRYVFRQNDDEPHIYSEKTKTIISLIEKQSDWLDTKQIFDQYKERTDEKFKIDSLFEVLFSKYMQGWNDNLQSLDENIYLDFWFECSPFLFKYIKDIRKHIFNNQQSFFTQALGSSTEHNFLFDYEIASSNETELILAKDEATINSWKIIESNVFDDLNKIVDSSINNIHNISNCVTKESTINYLDDLGTLYNCLCRMKNNIYNFVNSYEKLANLLILDKYSDNELFFATSLFSSLLFELIKSVNYATTLQAINNNDITRGTNLCFCIKNIERIFSKYLKDTQLNSNFIWNSKIFNIFTTKKIRKNFGYSITQEQLNKYIDPSRYWRLSNHTNDLYEDYFLNYIVWELLRNCRNPLFHSGLNSLLEIKDDTINYLYGYIRFNNGNPSSKKHIISHITALCKFVVKCYEFCYKSTSTLLNNKGILDWNDVYYDLNLNSFEERAKTINTFGKV